MRASQLRLLYSTLAQDRMLKFIHQQIKNEDILMGKRLSYQQASAERKELPDWKE